jgi:hypothetical protein
MLTRPAFLVASSSSTVLGHVVVCGFQVGTSIAVTRPQGECCLEVVDSSLVLLPVGQGRTASHQGIRVVGPQMQCLVVAVQGIRVRTCKQAEACQALAPESTCPRIEGQLWME